MSTYLARPERALIDSAVDHIYDLLGAAGYHCPYTGLFDPIAEALAALLDAAADQSTQRGVAAQLDEFEARLDDLRSNRAEARRTLGGVGMTTTRWETLLSQDFSPRSNTRRRAGGPGRSRDLTLRPT